MSKLTLFPGPRLERKDWEYSPETESGKWVPRDLTPDAAQYLFARVELDPEFTLADLLALVHADPVLLCVYRQDYAAELCAEAQKGVVVRECPILERMEYLELCRTWSLDTSTNCQEGTDALSMSGVGVVQEEDVREGEWVTCKKGERITWGISLTSVRELLHLPIRLRDEVPVSEADMDAKGYHQTLHTVTCAELTLGALIHAVLWELSWHGTPEETEAVAQTLDAQVASLDEGTAETVPHEDVMESLGFVSKKLIHKEFFEGSELLGDGELDAVLYGLEDKEPASAGLLAAFDGVLTLREEFQALNGHDLRRAIRLARYERSKK